MLEIIPEILSQAVSCNFKLKYWRETETCLFDLNLERQLSGSRHSLSAWQLPVCALSGLLNPIDDCQ